MDKFDMAHPNNEKRPMEANLLPCPFCGSKAHLSGCFPNGQYYIACTGCRVSLWYDRVDKAIGCWNSRINLKCDGGCCDNGSGYCMFCEKKLI